MDRPNTLYSRRAVRELHPNVQRLAWRDPLLLHRLSDTRIEGIRAWEYGVLIGCLTREPEHRDLALPRRRGGQCPSPVRLDRAVSGR